MYKSQIVLQLVVLYVGISHSWDIAVTHGNLLEFYTNVTKTNTIRLGSSLRALAYDEVHDMLLYVDTQSNNDAIYGYDIAASNTSKCFLERNGRSIHGLAFDPVTELVFFSDTNDRSINWISKKPNNSPSYHANLLIKLDDGIPTDIAVDSCKGNVYWISTNLTTPKIERIRFDGSERKVILNLQSLYINSYKLEPHSLVIDQGTQKMFWLEPYAITDYRIYCADLNGENKYKTTEIYFYKFKVINPLSNTMTVSKTALFMRTWCTDCKRDVVKLGKNKFIAYERFITAPIITNEVYSIVAKHEMRIQDFKNCDALTCLEGINSVEPYCVHGVKVSGRCLCKCASGYTGKRCDVSLCDNYCLQGNCSVNDEGLPKCRCNAGYSGERCGNSDGLYCVHGEKVIGQSVCKCAPGYIGERCDVSVCSNYCLHGNCSVNDEGLPECRCNAGYSGERCEIDACLGFCLNNGVCSLNEEDEPSCECVDGYQSPRCEVSCTP